MSEKEQIIKAKELKEPKQTKDKNGQWEFPMYLSDNPDKDDSQPKK